MQWCLNHQVAKRHDDKQLGITFVMYVCVCVDGVTAASKACGTLWLQIPRSEAL